MSRPAPRRCRCRYSPHSLCPDCDERSDDPPALFTWREAVLLLQVACLVLVRFRAVTLVLRLVDSRP